MTPDAQGAAFRDAGPADRVPDEDLGEWLEASHGPLVDLALVHTRDDYDAAGWDAERVGPKSVHDAREQLAHRIADPTAPDGPEVIGAYDNPPEVR